MDLFGTTKRKKAANVEARLALRRALTGSPRAPRLLAVAMLVAAAHGTGTVQDPEAPVDLPSMRAEAVEQNPDIRAARERWRAARARPSQEDSLPDPMINTAYHNESFSRLTQGRGDFSFLRFSGRRSCTAR